MGGPLDVSVPALKLAGARRVAGERGSVPGVETAGCGEKYDAEVVVVVVEETVYGVESIGVVGLEARLVRDAGVECVECVDRRRDRVGVSATGSVLVLWCLGLDVEGFSRSAFSLDSRGAGGGSRSRSRSFSLSLLFELLREWRPKRDGMAAEQVRWHQTRITARPQCDGSCKKLSAHHCHGCHTARNCLGEVV